MRISLHAPEVSNGLVSRIRQRVEAALARYDSIVENVALRLRDENGPRGGHDQACLITVAVSGGKEIIVTEKAETPLKAFGGAMKRVRRQLSQRMNFRPQTRRKAKSPRRLDSDSLLPAVDEVADGEL